MWTAVLWIFAIAGWGSAYYFSIKLGRANRLIEKEKRRKRDGANSRRRAKRNACVTQRLNRVMNVFEVIKKMADECGHTGLLVDSRDFSEHRWIVLGYHDPSVRSLVGSIRKDSVTREVFEIGLSQRLPDAGHENTREEVRCVRVRKFRQAGRHTDRFEIHETDQAIDALLLEMNRFAVAQHQDFPMLSGMKKEETA
ncbi:MAG: hypothetical protein JWL80_592 [Parcubacteria group bacterium]|nr:hypothetical protein [Parcubacteria group bacterium]